MDRKSAGACPDFTGKLTGKIAKVADFFGAEQLSTIATIHLSFYLSFHLSLLTLDVNECASGIYGCGAKAFCVNVMGK